MQDLPEWMLEAEVYEPRHGHDGFITKSILKLCRVLERFRETGRSGHFKLNPALKLVGVLYAIILSSCARNMFFVYILLALCIIYMCAMPGKALTRVFGSACLAALISAIILIPAIWLGNPQTMLTVALKVFVSVALMGILAETTPWNQLTAACAIFHVPSIFIFTLDIALKYIVVLGEISTHLLLALKLRSVGRNTKKQNAISGILGVTFIKSREMADEMYLAMVCRGFEGTYKRTKVRMGIGDAILLCLMIVLTIVFILLY